jgi:hypothetical protein
MRSSLAVALIAMTIQSVTAATLCRNGKGALFSRDACKKKETVVDPASLGAIGPPGPPGAQGAQGAQGPVGPSNPNANTLNGLTASQIVAQASGQTASAVLSFLNSAHTVTNAGTVFAGFCGCVSAFCPAGNFLTECNGAVTNDGTGFLTRIDDVNPEGCQVCGCTTGNLSTALAVSATCLSP